MGWRIYLPLWEHCCKWSSLVHEWRAIAPITSCKSVRKNCKSSFVGLPTPYGQQLRILSWPTWRSFWRLRVLIEPLHNLGLLRSIDLILDAWTKFCTTNSHTALSPIHTSHCRQHFTHRTVDISHITLSPFHTSHCHQFTHHTVTNSQNTLSSFHTSHCHHFTHHTVTISHETNFQSMDRVEHHKLDSRPTV